jgi:hypothetical protein
VLNEYQFDGSTIDDKFSSARATLMAWRMYVVQPWSLAKDGHFNAVVTQGLAQVQLPAALVHWPELRKFGLGLMLAEGLVIRKVAGGIGGVVVVVVGATVVVVVGAGVVLAGGASVVVGGANVVGVDDGCVLREAVLAMGDFGVETCVTRSEPPVRRDVIVANRRMLPLIVEFAVLAVAVVNATEELPRSVRNVVPGDVAETGSSATTMEKTLRDIANVPIRTKRRDREGGATPEGR